MPKRYPIQIEVTATNFSTILTVLCNDGTMWRMGATDVSKLGWHEIEPVPQPPQSPPAVLKTWRGLAPIPIAA